MNRQEIDERSPATGDCLGYEPGEIEQSRSPGGHLSEDVHEDTIAGTDYLLVVDFGVGRADIKHSARFDPLLQKWLDRFASESTVYQLRIEGVTDCVGDPEANERLQRERAQAFADILDAETRNRATITTFGEYYLVGNRSVVGRAANRAVIVEISRLWKDVDVDEETIVYNEKVRRAIEVWRPIADYTPVNQAFFESLLMLNVRGVDDRYVSHLTWFYRGAGAAIENPKSLRDHVNRVIDLSDSDKENRDRLGIEVLGAIEYGICRALKAVRLGANPCHQVVLDWMDDRMNDGSSIYAPWKGVTGITMECDAIHWNDPC